MNKEEPKKTNNNTALIIVIVVLVIVAIGAIITFSLVGYFSDNQKIKLPVGQQTPTQTATSTPVPTETVQAVPDQATPSDVVMMYMLSTLGTIPEATVDYDDAKNYVSAELAAQMDDPMFFPVSYCIQDGPSDIKIDSETTDPSYMEADISVSAKYGTFEPMWSFNLINGSGGWKIKSITCLQTDQVTQ